MTFSGHIAATAIILHYVPNPFLAIILSFVFHFVVDMIPHLEYPNLHAISLKSGILVSIDVIATLGLIIGLFLSSSLYLVIALALIAGVLPDIIHPLVKRYTPSLNRIHELCHSYPTSPDSPVEWDITITGQTPSWLKAFFQISLILWAFALLLAYT